MTKLLTAITLVAFISTVIHTITFFVTGDTRQIVGALEFRGVTDKLFTSRNNYYFKWMDYVMFTYCSLQFEEEIARS